MATYQDYDYDERPATESEAHVEWHLNSGVPMGTPGCPQDACHIDYDPSDHDAYGLDEDFGPRIVAIVGSRDFPRLDLVQHFVRALQRKYPRVMIVSGGARGVDRCAEDTAKAVGLDVLSYRVEEVPAKLGGGFITRTTFSGEQGSRNLRPTNRPARFGGAYSQFAAAAHARNQYIAEDCDHLVAFTTGSAGTASTIAKAQKLDKPVHVYFEEDFDNAV